MRVELARYNRGRLAIYQTETTIVHTEEGRVVRKRPLVPEAKAHVESLVQHHQTLQALKCINCPKPKHHGDYVVCALVEGRSYEWRMLTHLAAGDLDGFHRQIDSYIALLRSFGTSKVKRYRPGSFLGSLFPTEFELTDVEVLPVTDLDLTFDNLYIDKEGFTWVTDYEWVYDEPVPLDLILFRALYVFLMKNKHRTTGLDVDALYARYEFTGTIKERYQQACERFIDHVHGPDRPNLIPSSYQMPVNGMGPVEELEAFRVKFEQAQQELAQAYVMLEGRKAEVDEMLKRITQAETRYLQAKAQLALSEKSLEQQNQHVLFMDQKLLEAHRSIEELVGKVRDMQATLVRINDELEASKVDLLEQRSQSMNEIGLLRGQAEQDKVRLDLYAKEVANLYLMLSDLRGIIDAKDLRIKELLDMYEKKHRELMTMSDWAYNMKLRLEFIDSSPSVLRAERYAKLRKEAKDTLKAEGITGLIRGTMRRYLPTGTRQRSKHQMPADMTELAQAVRNNKGKLLLVFPIIPWEFRWQRPQQIVSRFAQNGYAVLFVNMTINPIGKRYDNPADAVKDIKIGKLDENIYQCWLSSVNRLNVYKDRIEGDDLTNLLYGLKAIMKEVSPLENIYAVQFPGWADLATALKKKKGGALVFDCMDEHAGFSTNADDVIKDEEKLFRHSDLVITTSDRLFEKAKDHNDSVVMVRNGTDFDFFHNLQPNGELDGLRRPIIGYYGAISDWFDTSIVEHCAKKHPEWTFVLIGSTVGCDCGCLEKLGNIKLLGEKPYKSLPGYLAYFDVCTIPFKINPLTLATNPVKFYEYLSSGKAVVTVPLPELKVYQDMCYLADGPEAFEAALRKALAENDPALKERRIKFAQENSWDERYRKIRMALDEV